MPWFDPETVRAFHLLRHVALFFFGAGLVYGLQVRRHAQPALLMPWALAGAGMVSLWHAFLFLWSLAMWGPAPVGAAVHHLVQVLALGTELALWFVRPYREQDARRFFGGVAAGVVLAFFLALGWMLLGWHPLPLLKALLVLLVLVAGGALYRARDIPRGRVFVYLAAGMVLAAALWEAFFVNALEYQTLLLGLAEMAVAPLLLAWPYAWLPLPRPEEAGRRPPTAALTPSQAQALLFPYLEQLDALLLAQSRQQPWNPVPSMVQAVFTWLHHRLGPSREPRSHTPLPHLAERVLERHEDQLVERHFQLSCSFDSNLSLDPSLGEWLLELGFSYVLRHAAPDVAVECRLHGGLDPTRGPVLYARLRHSILAKPWGLPEAWFEPALTLGKLFLMDMGGDWWVEEENHTRTIWLVLPLQGFGKILHAPASRAS